MELFVIPTHRHCLKAIDSIIREMQIFKEKNKGELSLAILDNGDTTVSMYNRNYLNKIKEKHGFEIYYIDTGHMKKLSDCIAREIGIDEKEMGELLIPRKIDYGKIFNLIYLVSMVLNADNLHRRDSDCYFGETCQEEEYSINEENKYLGKAINRVIEDGELEVIDEIHFRDNEKIVIAGSNYIGNWNIDLHELAKKNKDVSAKLLEICDIPKDSIEEQVSSNYSKKSCEQLKKKAILKSSFRVPDVPECGNVSMCEIFKYIPNFVGENGIGFDYFTYFMGFLMKSPIVFHQKRIQHIHDAKRYKSIDIYNYWLGIIKMVDLDLIYTKFIKEGYPQKLMKDKSGIEAIKCIYEKEFPDAIERIIGEIDIGKRIEKFNNVVKEILLASGIDKYMEIGNELIGNRKKIMSMLDKDYRDSIHLLRLWKKITASARKQEILKNEWKLQE